MGTAAARLSRARPSAAWLLPLAALLLWSYGARGHPLGLPTEWAPAALAIPVGLAVAAWVVVLHREQIIWLGGAAVVGLVLAAILALDPTHTLRHLWNTRLRLELVGGAGVVVAVGAWLGRRRASPPRPLDLLVGFVLVAMLIGDLAIVHSTYQRDLNLYLDAGHDFLSGVPVYAQQPLTAAPPDPTQLPFVYPPATLPFFAGLASLPQPVVAIAWLLLGISASFLAIRALGVPWRWAAMLFAWPPFVQGIWVGNVAIWMILLFVLIPWRPWLVGLPAVFKFQTAVAGLWLIRERRWRSLAATGLLVGGLVLVTLPIVGVAQWVDWYHGLMAFQQSVGNIPPMSAYAISRFVGETAALLLGAALVVSAFRLRGGSSLANLGLAGIAVSPTLYLHGLTMALPALLRLRAAVFWLVVLVAVVAGFQGSVWVLLVVAGAAGLVPMLRHQAGTPEAAWQPLGPAMEPWPNAPFARSYGSASNGEDRVSGRPTT